MIRVAFVVGDYPPEQLRLREDAARGYSSAEVEVGIVRVAARPFDGLGPAEIQAAAPLFHEAFRQAEREGYDASRDRQNDALDRPDPDTRRLWVDVAHHADVRTLG